MKSRAIQRVSHTQYVLGLSSNGTRVVAQIALRNLLHRLVLKVMCTLQRPPLVVNELGFTHSLMLGGGYVELRFRVKGCHTIEIGDVLLPGNTTSVWIPQEEIDPMLNVCFYGRREIMQYKLTKPMQNHLRLARVSSSGYFASWRFGAVVPKYRPIHLSSEDLSHRSLSLSPRLRLVKLVKFGVPANRLQISGIIINP